MSEIFGDICQDGLNNRTPSWYSMFVGKVHVSNVPSPSQAVLDTTFRVAPVPN